MNSVLEPEPGDVLLNSTGTGTIGRSCVFEARGRFIVDGHVTVLRLRSEAGVGRWLSEVLRTPWGQIHLETQCYSGSTNQVELSRTRLAATRLPMPPLPEQRRIAEILETVDEAIRKTEEIIAKLEQVKQGLLHDLLTRGIDDNGELRDPDRHPEQFKDSPLGRIPQGLGGATVGRVSARYPDQRDLQASEPHRRGCLLVGQAAFTSDRSIDYRFARRAVVSDDEQRRYGLAVGDVLVSRVFATLRGVGQPTLVPPVAEPAVYESNMMRLRVDESVVVAPLVFHCLRSQAVRRLVESGANISNQASINQSTLNRLPITYRLLRSSAR